MNALFDINVMQMVHTLGYAGLFLILFVETGLFLGFFLPGDSLIITAGFLASQGIFDIWILIILLPIAAFLGYAVGYWFGKYLGKWLLGQRETIFFRRSYLDRAHVFYDKYGQWAVILARFVPVVRTFVPIFAGMTTMNYKSYLICNCIGAILWGGVLTLLGYILGHAIPNAGRYFLPIILGIILISVIPMIWHGIQHYRHRKTRT